MTTQVTIVCDRCGARSEPAPGELLAFSMRPPGWRRVVEPASSSTLGGRIVDLCGECAK